MSKHTPGPWFLDGQFKDEGQWQIQLSEDNGWRGDEYMRVGGVVSDANARLIAAAPELLEALELIIKRFMPTESELIFSKRAALVKARAALAKATGETE